MQTQIHLPLYIPFLRRQTHLVILRYRLSLLQAVEGLCRPAVTLSEEKQSDGIALDKEAFPPASKPGAAVDLHAHSMCAQAS